MVSSINRVSVFSQSPIEVQMVYRISGRRAGLNSDQRARAVVCMSAFPATELPAYDTSSFTRSDVGLSRREHLLEKARRELRAAGEAVEKMKMIDTIQRLGIGYYMEDEINSILLSLSTMNSDDEEEEDLFAAALRFRLLRHNGHHVRSDVFGKFLDKNGRLQESLAKDTLGLLSFYEASFMATHDEKILTEAMDFTRNQLKTSISEGGLQPACRVVTQQVKQALQVPRHHRMARLETKRFIEEYATQIGHSPMILELAVLDYNEVQTRYRLELDEIKKWWKQLGLMENLSFCRDRFLECFFWIVGILPDPKYSGCRVEIAKSIAILLVIDDIFDTYGKMDDLVLFTEAIQRWDLEAMEGLPHYMKICYMALYNTTNEICFKILKQTGWNSFPCLKQSWIDMIEGYMLEAKWFSGGERPRLEEYVENGVSTVGAYMALVHIFFLMGEGITAQNAQTMLHKPYPKLFSSTGRIFRLWDDLGTGKEEQERGDMASVIYMVMREKGITEEEGRNRVVGEIKELWKDLNEELISSKNGMSLSIIKVALDMARASQVVYNHKAQTYLSNVDNYVHTLFFAPLLL